MRAYDVDLTEEMEIEINQHEEGLVFFIDEETLLTDYSEYLVSMVNKKRPANTLLTLQVNLESINARKVKQLTEIFHSVLIYFEAEEILVVWNYEATDEKAYDAGVKIQAQTKINFSFQVY